jgi:hypothetical protein
MRVTLKHTLRLHDHLGSLARTHFELRAPFLDQSTEVSDAETYRAYLQEVVTDRAHYSDLTPDQRYLHDLAGLPSPVISAYRLRLRLPRLKPRTGDIRASARLEDCCQQLAIVAYNFRERVKAFGESSTNIIHSALFQSDTSNRIGKIIRQYDESNDRILRYRNFIVHGPKGRIDEFADLRSWELGGIFLHTDLWLDYNNAFEEVRCEWTSISRNLLASMESSIAIIQLLNENLITVGAFNFLQIPGAASSTLTEIDSSSNLSAP